MKVLSPENYSMNDSKITPSKSVTSANSFKTVLRDINSTKCKLNSVEKNDLTYTNNEEMVSLCGIDSSLVNCNNTINNGVSATINKENEEGISSCYECEVRDDCQRFKKDKTDILMNMNVSLKTKYDPNFEKNVPLLTSKISENEIFLYQLPVFSQSFYFDGEHKRAKIDKEGKN